MGHLIRAEEDDLRKTYALSAGGIRVAAGHKRRDRPRIKWYDQVLDACIDKRTKSGILLPKWSTDMRRDEAIQRSIDTAEARVM